MIFAILFLLVRVSSHRTVWHVSVSYSFLLSKPSACCLQIFRFLLFRFVLSVLVFLVSLLLAVLRFLITSEIQRSICYVQSLVCSKVRARSTLDIGNFPPLGHLLVGLYLHAGCWNCPRRPFFASRGLFRLLLSILFWVFIYLFILRLYLQLASSWSHKRKETIFVFASPPILGFSMLLIPMWSIFWALFQLSKKSGIIWSILRAKIIWPSIYGWSWR